MRIWIICHGEALPIEPDIRKYRVGMLFDECRAQGHEVTWWATTFWHLRKIRVRESSETLRFGENGKLRLLECGTYMKNVSLARLRHHQRFASQLEKEFHATERPEVILCCYPVIEAAAVAIRFAKSNGIPIVLDVRDRWPDQYLEYVPRVVRGLARIALGVHFRRAHYCFSTADRLTSMSRGMLEWALTSAARERGTGDRVFHIGYEKDKSGGSRRSEDGVIRFAYAGTFGNTYDIEMVLRVFSALEKVDGLLKWSFTLGGKGERCDTLRQQYESERIRFAGWLDEAGMEALMNESDWGLVPWASEAGAFPNKVFEYFSYGIPIVSSIKGELWDLVNEEEVGFNFDISDSENLETVIRRCLVESGDLERYRHRVNRLFKARFESKNIYGEFVKFLVDVGLGGQARKQGQHVTSDR